MTAGELAAFLDRTLHVAEFAADSSHNGLQVGDESRPVDRVCCGVDASLEFYRSAANRGADFLICHHGFSWGDSLKRITGLNHRHIAFLVENKLALYASHLPLDAHPLHGNNAVLCRRLGLKRIRRFGTYHGMAIGFAGDLARSLPLDAFSTRVGRVVGGDVRVMASGPARVRTVAVVSGAAADLLDEAGRKGVDVYVSGEPQLKAYNLAAEHGINAVFAGHYATEKFGVMALAELIRRRFGLWAEFVDLHVPY